MPSALFYEFLDSRATAVVATPNDSWTKERIIAWLAQRGIIIDTTASPTLTKAELLDIVRDLLDVP